MQKQDDLKRSICEAIDRRKFEIINIGDHIMNNPELGFKEFSTAKLVASTMSSFEIPHETDLAITGVKGVIEGKRPGPTVAIIGELDSLLVPDHPNANPNTGAAHACGHNAQIAGLLGAMMGLVDTKAHQDIAGRVVIFAVPAEEYVEIEYRLGLIREGKLSFLGGKPELIRLGHFDDIDMAIMIHSHSKPEMKKAIVTESNNGCLVKLIQYEGVASHSGAAPHRGINALNAANIAMAGIHAQRETFKDDDAIRVHPIITKGGALVNVVPADVRLETFVRGKTQKAILDTNIKVDRALKAGALAIGAKVKIHTLPGYMPLSHNPKLKSIYFENAAMLLGEEECSAVGHSTGSTDMGDISNLMPALHAHMAGPTGIIHGNDFIIADKEMSYVTPAKVLALMVIDLLYGEGESAREIIDKYPPSMTKDAYLDLQKKSFYEELFDGSNF